MGAEVALPGEALLEEAVVVAGPAPPTGDGEVPAQALLQERADLVAERLVLGRQERREQVGGAPRNA